jgi:hypothetical protein
LAAIQQRASRKDARFALVAPASRRLSRGRPARAEQIRCTAVPSYHVLAVARFFIALLLVGLPTVFLWNFLTALLFRLFGVRLPLLPFAFKASKQASQLLTFSQSVWVGVIQFGCGMFICMTLYEYLAWKYWDAPWSHFPIRIRVYAVMWPAVGLLIGLIRADDNRCRRLAAGSSKSEAGPSHS